MVPNDPSGACMPQPLCSSIPQAAEGPARGPQPAAPAPMPSRSRAAVLAAGWAALCLVAGFSLAGTSPTPRPAVPAPLAAQSLLLDVASADDLLAAAGERGHILLSRDAGRTWEQAQVPVQALLTGIHLLDGHTGWAVGHDGVLLRTADGGRTWELRRWAPEEEKPLLHVWFRDPERGFAAGAYGLLLTTTDGGATWSEQPVADDEWHLNHVAGSATGRIYIAAEAGHIFRSDDGGETWRPLPSPYEGSFFGTLPLDGDEVLLYGLRGHLFRSSDAGESWEEVESGTEASLTSGLVLRDGTVRIAGLEGTVLESACGRPPFSLRRHDDRKGISALAETQDGRVVAVGEFGVRLLER
ncbi:MAG: WD40/YVTN/BNR-like repeat-containing protein [Deferrisomatales bacterium]